MNDRELARRSDAVERLLELRAARRDRADAEPTADRTGPVAAAGRVLAEPVHAERDVPTHDRATMDGFAFAAGERVSVVPYDAVE